MVKLKNIFCGVGMLAICSVVAKLLGAFFRIPLTNILGAQGMGIYQMVFPIYSVVLTISCGGIPVAISKLVASKSAEKDVNGVKSVLKVGLLAVTIVGLSFSVALVLLHNLIAHLQGNSQASLAYLGIAPSILCVCIVSVFRGYFQGKLNMLPSSVMQIVEQFAKLSFGIGLSLKFLEYGVEYAVLGAVIGISISEAVAMSVMLLFYCLEILKTKFRMSKKFSRLALQAEIALDWNISDYDVLKAQNGDSKSTLRQIYKVAIPVTLGALIFPLTQVVDSVVVINYLTSVGYSKDIATAQFGILNGPVSSLINLPVLITLAISIALLPKVAKAYAMGEGCTQVTIDAMRYSLLIAIPTSIGLLLFAKDIMYFMYGRGLDEMELNQGAKILQLTSTIVFYASIMQVCTATMQGMDDAFKPAAILGIVALIKVLATLIFIYFWGIYGVALAGVVFYMLACMLNIIICKSKIDFKKTSITAFKILVSASIAFGLSWIVRYFCFGQRASFVALMLCGLGAASLYTLLLLALGCLKHNMVDAKSLPIQQ